MHDILVFLGFIKYWLAKVGVMIQESSHLNEESCVSEREAGSEVLVRQAVASQWLSEYDIAISMEAC